MRGDVRAHGQPGRNVSVRVFGRRGRLWLPSTGRLWLAFECL